MEIEIKQFHCSDSKDLETFSVPTEDIFFPIEMAIGPVGDERADIYSFMLVSKEALRKRAISPARDARRKYLFVRSYDWRTTRNTLENIVRGFAGESWEEMVRYLTRYFYWEYEGISKFY